MNENNYMIRGLVLYQFKYYCVEATALSVLVNHYPLRQKGSEVGCLGGDSTAFYVFTVDSTDSFFYKFSQLTDLVPSAVLILHILTMN